MNGVKKEYSIKVKQTSKGVWYCDGLQVIADKSTTLVEDLDSLMILIKGTLRNHNFVEPVETEVVK